MRADLKQSRFERGDIPTGIQLRRGIQKDL